MLESGTKQPGLCLPLGNSWHASREAPGTTLSGEPRFPDLAVIGRVETEVERDGKIEREDPTYLCTTELSEEPLHWMLDICISGISGRLA